MAEMTVVTIPLRSDLVREVGLNEAVMLLALHSYLQSSGQESARLTYAQWSALIGGILSERTMRRAVTALEAAGAVRSRAESGGSRTPTAKFYSIGRPELLPPQTLSGTCPVCSSGHIDHMTSGQNDQMASGQIGQQDATPCPGGSCDNRPVRPDDEPRAYICNTLTQADVITEVDQRVLPTDEGTTLRQVLPQVEHAEEKAGKAQGKKGKKPREAKKGAQADTPAKVYDAAFYDWPQEVWEKIKHENFRPEGVTRHVVLMAAYVVGMQRTHGRREFFFDRDIGGHLGVLARQCMEHFAALEHCDEAKGIAAALEYVAWYVQVKGNEWLDQTGKTIKGCFTPHNYQNTYVQARTGRPSSKGRGSLANGDGTKVYTPEERRSGKLPPGRIL
jgi:hypothetical protein